MAASASMTTTQNADGDTGGEKMKLERNIGLPSAIALIVGSIIGSGIFITPKGVLEGTGSVGASLLVWAACGVLSIFGSLCYSELGSMIPKSGGDFSYYMASYGPLHKFVGPIPAFLYSWVSTLLIMPSSIAIITMSFAQYAVAPLYDDCGPPPEVTRCLTVFTILLLLFINCFSVNLAARVQTFFTGTKMTACAIVIIGGFVNLGRGRTQHFANSFDGTTANALIVASAFYKGLWAFDGWNSLNFVTEELKNPKRNLSLAIFIAIPLVTATYLLMNISYYTVMSPAELLASPAVGVTWGNEMLGVMSWSIPVFVALSAFGAANGALFASGRLCYASAREGHLMEVLSMVHVRRNTPAPALIFTALISLMMTAGSINGLIDFFGFVAWMFYGTTMVALLILRWTKRDAPRPYKVPIFIPVIVLLAACYLVVAPIIDQPSIGFLAAFIVILSGVFLYIPFVYFKVHFKCTDYATVFLQKLMEVVPADPEEA